MLSSVTNPNNSITVVQLDCFVLDISILSQVRLLRLGEPLAATITSREYIDLKLKGFPKKMEQKNVLDNAPMISVLQLGDKSSCGGMSIRLPAQNVHLTDEAFKNLMGLLIE
jgi:hypothetical protein